MSFDSQQPHGACLLENPVSFDADHVQSIKISQNQWKSIRHVLSWGLMSLILWAHVAYLQGGVNTGVLAVEGWTEHPGIGPKLQSSPKAYLGLASNGIRENYAKMLSF